MARVRDIVLLTGTICLLFSSTACDPNAPLSSDTNIIDAETTDLGSDLGDSDTVATDADGPDQDDATDDELIDIAQLDDMLTDDATIADDGSQDANDAVDIAPECALSEQCDDGNPCNGQEDCQESACVDGLPLTDGTLCSTDTVESGTCRAAACAPIACPNGYAEPGEVCDGDDLTGETCLSLGFEGGDLACLADCTFDIGDCWCRPGYSGDPAQPELGCQLSDPCKTEPVEGSVAELIFEGSGSIPSSTGLDVLITSPENCIGGMMDIVIIPDGYTAEDMQRFRWDAQLWLEDFVELTPFDQYVEAFNVWIVPLPSDGHIAAGSASTSQTRLNFYLNGSAVTAPSSGTTERTEMHQAFFDALDHVSRNRTHTYPNDGARNAAMALQTVGVVLVLNPNCAYMDDPDRFCDGYSGHARSFSNPSGDPEMVRGAIARNRLHEFGHAFALLRDEYRSDTYKDCTSASYLNGYNPDNWTIRTINNYAYENDGAGLPWRHLLYSAGINSTPGIVGAYQGAFTCWDGAWRPEYRCLMNGSHGNTDSCHPAGGAGLRQTDYCNWCRELVVMRIYEKIGWLDSTDELQDWIDNWRDWYWLNNPITLPNAGLPIEDTCGVEVAFEPPPTGVPCEGHTNEECVDNVNAPYCGWSDSAGISYCTRVCTVASECEDLFSNPCCAQGAVRKMCRPESDPRCGG